MAWSAGNFTRALGPNQWQNDAAAAVGIQAGIHDTQDNDLATGIDQCLNKNGQNSPTGPISLGGFNFTNVANATLRNQFASLGQVQDGAFLYGGVSTGNATVMAIAVTPPIPAYADGQHFFFVSGFENNVSPTLNVNGLGAIPIRDSRTGVGLLGKEILLNMRTEVVYSGGNFYLLNSAAGSVWIDYSGIIGTSGDGVNTFTLTAIRRAVYLIIGKIMFINVTFAGNLSGTLSTSVAFTLPTGFNGNAWNAMPAVVYAPTGIFCGLGLFASSNIISIHFFDSRPMPNGAYSFGMTTSFELL